MIKAQKRYHSNGKLMISGEYLVLAGAAALAIPVKYGQVLTVTAASAQKSMLSWHAKENGQEWFSAEFSPDQLNDTNEKPSHSHQEHVCQNLIRILKQARAMNPEFLKGKYHWSVITEMDFDRNWGLGSSSSLISNIAWWADVDPYKLLFKTLGGSGYDVACAHSPVPLLYKYRGVDEPPDVQAVAFDPAFSEQLFFVYTGKKQNSAKSLKNFDARLVDAITVDRITHITDNMLNASDLNVFMELMFEHEHIISQQIGMMPVQLENFPDFDGAVKSLGAWGGDFILAASKMNKASVEKYFKDKGLQVIIPFDEMVLKG